MKRLGTPDQLIDILRMYYRRLPFRRWHLNTMHSMAESTSVYPNVKWLSHHIPKTAGRSLEAAFYAAIGRKRVFAAYSDHRAPYLLSNGLPLWVPRKTLIIHGHFRPHQAHTAMFPNAKRIIWIRDPVDRNVSLLKYIRRTDLDRPEFKRYRDRHTNEKSDFADLFQKFLTDPDLFRATRIYARYLGRVNPEDFAFIGKAEDFDNEIVRLGKLMELDLVPTIKNAAPPENKAFDRRRFELLLRDEYRLLEKWTGS